MWIYMYKGLGATALVGDNYPSLNSFLCVCVWCARNTMLWLYIIFEVLMYTLLLIL